ncbi:MULTISPECIES: DUF481 domain-containing protein [Shewanella]|uniref:Salt-induced outer membrane protein n=2 Tax=Shewanella TaxID=22 RepID=A0ABX5PPC6_9GAMM|nr:MULTISPECIES: DUF481 domain-containing protein [Shewanella]MCL1153776.1 DUF481 domain-containing protein [Shewanella chilikensis]PYE58867.1 putative salt-induced outer membrane protein [Shewanella chilikensis]BCV65220.1 hypothetical protein TUM17387_05790 [Shewanella carassii]GGE71307.1 hypothetical protein GCM10011520_09900 [Shewanella carassii]GGZ27806.1 hypothetical protein GCM10007105_14070 [Shewanella chilikensis]
MTRSSVLALLFALPTSAWALVPPDYREPPSDFTAEIEAGFQLNTGNTDSSSFNGRTKLVYDTENAKQEGTLKAYFASDSEKTTAEKYNLQLQSNYKLNGGYIFGRGEFIWDKFGSYTEIYTVSSGYGFDAISTRRTKLSLEVGPGYRYNMPIETDAAPDPVAEKDVILRTAAKFEQKIHEYTSFTADLTAEVGENNNTLALDMGYKNTLFQDWAFKIGFNVKYTEVVPEGSKQTDTITTFNLLYTFQ